MEVGEQLDFSVAALSATGDTIDIDEIDIEWQWWSTDTDVFMVEPGGLATAQNPGEAFCMIEAVVEVTHRAAEEIDMIHAGIRFPSTSVKNIEGNKVLHLTLENRHDVLEAEKAFIKKKLRFTGRDSEFVMVF